MKKVLGSFVIVTCAVILSGCMSFQQRPVSEKKIDAEQTKKKKPKETKKTNETIDKAEGKSDTEKKDMIFQINDEKMSLSSAGSWRKLPNPEKYNEDADFLLVSGFKNYILGLVETKEEAEEAGLNSFEEYVEALMEEYEVATAKDITVNGLKGKSIEFEEEIEGDTFGYLVYFIETDQHYVQLMSYTFAKDFKENRSKLEAELQTFKAIELGFFSF